MSVLQNRQLDCPILGIFLPQPTANCICVAWDLCVQYKGQFVLPRLFCSVILSIVGIIGSVLINHLHIIGLILHI